MDLAFENVWEIATRDKVTMRMACYILAVNRVSEAMLLRGLYP